MINKFKDFLKKLSRKRNDDFNDQDEFLDDSDLPEGIDEEVTEEPKSSWKDKLKISLPTFRKKKSEDESFPLEMTEDKTGETSLPEEESAPKSSWKDKLKISLPAFSKKKSEEAESYSQLDATAETEIPTTSKTSFKERFSQSVSGIRSKFTNVNLKEWKLPEGMRAKQGESMVSLSPSLTKSIEKLLSRDARETIHQISLVFLICGFTYTIGKVTALVLKGAPVIDSPRSFTVALDLENDFNPQTLNQVKRINIFRTNTGLGSKKKVADTKCEEASGESDLPIKLINTVVLQDSVKSLASVQIRGERALQEVREGDQISNLARIFKITRLELLVKNLESGACESIANEKAKDVRSSISVMTPAQSREFKANKKMAGIENEGNKFVISKALLDEKMKDIAAILTQARAIKIQNPDGTMAFKLTEMDPQGIFPYLGLQDQDIITSINGKPIYDMNEVMGLFAKIKNLDKLQLGVRREGSDSMMDYNIKK